MKVNYDEGELIHIAGIQHFHYCKRQWALIHIEGLWEENARTAKGQVIHSRVHDSSLTNKRGDVITSNGLRVRCLKYGFYGVCDSVEFTLSESGTTIPGRLGRFSVKPVEYKVGSPKKDNLDAVQLCLQCLALEEMLGTTIDNADIFYHETRRRQNVCIDAELRKESVNLVLQMHALLEMGVTPKPTDLKKCKNCSLKDVCVPNIAKRNLKVSDYIQNINGDVDP